MRNCLWSFFAATLLAAGLESEMVAAAEPPKVGDKAPGFALSAPNGSEAKLETLVKTGPVVLLVLRGFPGYQCPLCTKQVGEFVAQAEAFKAAGAKVVLIYPGPAAKLNQRAQEFLGATQLPDHYLFVTDPDYAFTNAYHLRWDAPRETAYPSTFVVDAQQNIVYAMVSNSHGGRSKPAEVLKAIPSKSSVPK